MASPELGEGELCRSRESEGSLDRSPGVLHRTDDASDHVIGMMFRWVFERANHHPLHALCLCLDQIDTSTSPEIFMSQVLTQKRVLNVLVEYPGR